MKTFTLDCSLKSRANSIKAIETESSNICVLSRIMAASLGSHRGHDLRSVTASLKFWARTGGHLVTCGAAERHFI